MARRTDNGNTLSVQGGGFRSRLSTHPCDGVRVEAEAGNGHATWEIIQLSDQRGHTRGLITSSTAGQLVQSPRAGASQLATLTLRNTFCLNHSHNPPEPRNAITFNKKFPYKFYIFFNVLYLYYLTLSQIFAARGSSSLLLPTMCA